MTSKPSQSERRVIVLGSTGSIGTSALEVIEHLGRCGHPMRVVGLAAGGNAARLAEQARRFNVDAVAVADVECAASFGTARVIRGAGAARELVESVDADLVVAAIVGSAGLPAVLAAIDRGMDVALANKEALVAAGSLVMPRARQRGVRLLPVDSEHSAIFQCLPVAKDGPAHPDVSSVRRIILTASGGPFRTWPVEQLRRATVEQALRHPTWSMGAKVTIDSASLINKGLELIEAHWLFGVDDDRLDVLVHPQSIVHGLVEFNDGSVLAQMGAPDMKTPIQYALMWPARPEGCSRRLDWTEVSRLDFEPVDGDRFPAPALARRVIRQGGTSGAVFNGANEEAVAAFTDHRIEFGRITDLVAEALDSLPHRPVDRLDDVLTAEAEAREFVRARLR